jgi:hypothetical protein
MPLGHQFHLASVAKVMTATIVLQLAEEGAYRRGCRRSGMKSILNIRRNIARAAVRHAADRRVGLARCFIVSKGVTKGSNLR